MRTYYHRAGMLLFLLSVLCLTTTAQQQKPNIILIMADDLGYETLEANGGASYKTPHLNAMAKAGMRFENAHANPLCTPSRVQLMTGKYNFRNYIGFGLLDPAELTFAHLLKDAGYVTGVTGKWQLLGLEGEQRDAGNRKGSYPTEAGFDDYCLWQVEQRLSRYKDPVITTKGNVTKELKGEYGPAVFTKFAQDFISTNRDKPFFLYYPMVLTHHPFQPVPGTPEYKNFDAEKTNDTTYFGGMVAYMDNIVGKILDKVRQEGISRNTLVIFMGDNGTDASVSSTINGRTVWGGKSGHGDNATHIPMIAYWDGVIQPGTTNRNLIDFTDFLPTFLATAGAKAPLYFYTDGISFYDQLKGKPDAASREYVFCSYDPKRGKNRKPGTWIHNKEWKLYQTGEFFHLVKDPEEKHPLSPANMNDVAAKVKAQLQEAMKDILDKKV